MLCQWRPLSHVLALHLVPFGRFVTTRNLDLERQLDAIAAGTMRAPEILEASARVMAVAPGAQWSRAASHHGRALYGLGRLAEGFAVMEEAWQRADSLDDPLTGAIATRMGAVC